MGLSGIKRPDDIFKSCCLFKNFVKKEKSSRMDDYIQYGLEVIFLCLTQLSMTFILLINVKMAAIVWILSFISRKVRSIFIFQQLSFYDQIKPPAQLN